MDTMLGLEITIRIALLGNVNVAYADTFDKVTKNGKDTLKIAKDADFGSVGLSVQFTFTLSESNKDIQGSLT